MRVHSVNGKRRRPFHANKLRKRSRLGNFITFVIIAALAGFMAMPFIFAVSNAFKPLDEIFMFPPRFFVKNPTLDNFQDLFVLLDDSFIPISRYLFNTSFITVVGTVGNIIACSLAAFVLAKCQFPGKKGLFKIVVLSLMFSGAVTSIPNYLIMSKLNWIDSYLSIIVPAFATPMGLFLMKQFMEGLPDTIIEAATIDGAGTFRIFAKIAMPMVKPAWLTLMIFSIQGLWNNGGGNFIFDERLKPLPYAMSQIVSGGVARQGVGGAVGVIMMIVPILVFIITQSNIIETMASSGIKE